MNTKRMTLMGILMSTAVVCAGMGNEVTTVIAGTENDNLASDSIYNLQEVVVSANFSNERMAPLNIATVTPQDLLRHASAPNFIEVMQGIPGVYATASTGSYGDASLNMRGFKQENISIMLNGIPIQGLTSGSMYWNNWMGLSDATYSIQVQKGLGGSMLADCSLGGMVNIVTKTSTESPRTTFGVNLTEYGTTKTSLGYSSGVTKGGWSVDLNLSYVKGKGYVEKTDVETFSYMLSVSKILGEYNSLIFTALGSPEKHDQRNTELTAAEVDKYGRDYSKNWGSLRGKAVSIGHNHYYKPYFTLQHIMNGERLSMKNSIYLAIADGGGTSTYNNYLSGVKGIIDHQTSDGHIDFDAVLKENESDGVSKNVLIDFLSGHTQIGAIASGEYKLSQPWSIGAGLQYQYYKTWQKMEVLDLLGGEYFVDPQTKKQLTVGDYAGAGTRYGRTTHHASGFVQAKYDSKDINANVGVSVFHGNFQRANHETDAKSGWAHGWGASVKGGILYRLIDDGQNTDAIYLNAAFNSRLPYAGIFLANSNLSISDVHNEKNLLSELGWKKTWKGGQLELSGYVASWRNKTLTVSQSKQANAAAEKFHITGLNALHMGLELSASQYLTQWLRVSAYAMTASWKWKSAGNAITYDTYSGATLQEKSINCDGLHVGDAPQTQLGAKVDIRMPKGFYAHAGWQYNARMYADFEPSSRTTDDKSDAYKLPSYHLVDAALGWEGKIVRNIRMNIFARGTNLLDTKYIERGTDGASHDLDTFKGYWGQARTMSIGMRLSF